MSLSSFDGAVQAGKTFGRDLLERVLASFVGGFVGGITVATPLDGSMWYAALSGGVAAAVSLVKGLLARLKDDKNSASLAKGV